jgi:hypothetical protein
MTEIDRLYGQYQQLIGHELVGDLAGFNPVLAAELVPHMASLIEKQRKVIDKLLRLNGHLLDSKAVQDQDPVDMNILRAF